MGQRREVTLHQGYAIWADSYDHERNPLIMTEEPRVQALLERLRLREKHALDVATGTGRWALYLAARGSHVIAIDDSPEMLALARKKACEANLSVQFKRRDLRKRLPYPSGHFHLVVCALALCHVADLEGAVAEFGRVLQPGGHLIITDFHPQAVANGWATTILRGDDTYTLPTMQHSRAAYLYAIDKAGCDVIHLEEVLVQDQPEEANLHGEDIDEFMRRYGDWPFCLIILAQRRK